MKKTKHIICSYVITIPHSLQMDKAVMSFSRQRNMTHLSSISQRTNMRPSFMCSQRSMQRKTLLMVSSCCPPLATARVMTLREMMSMKMKMSMKTMNTPEGDVFKKNILCFFLKRSHFLKNEDLCLGASGWSDWESLLSSMVKGCIVYTCSTLASSVIDIELIIERCLSAACFILYIWLYIQFLYLSTSYC